MRPPHPPSTARYVVGVIHHADWDLLPRCLASLRTQTLAPDAVFVVDTGVDGERLAPVRSAFPEVVFEVRRNGGWGPA
ncbi:MAG: hypothetical protein M5U32_10905 [Myxococcota bacterium]|nr:hypothetical protein [Myxococcota bacterium]